jgi:glucose-6-phosphate isomerase, archaeal
MTELSLSGLPIEWNPHKKRLVFASSLEDVDPAIRKLGEMQDVLYRKGGNRPENTDPRRELYYMYRDVHLREHKNLFREKGIRYDITVIVPGTIGEEYVKTAGHYHPVKPGTDFTYPEVYEVLHGRAHYLFQRPHNPAKPGKGIDEVIVVAADPGDKVLIPSGYGHITVNPGDDYLIMSNLVADDFASIYDPLQEMGGGGYCQLASPAEEDDLLFVSNPSYLTCPPLHYAVAVDLPQFSLIKEIPQYRAFVDHPQDFTFLTHPENFQKEFNAYLEALKNYQE